MERIRVSFSTGTAAGAGVGGLTWGQQQVFRAMREMGSSMSMGGVVPVHDARQVADFADELRFLMTRYPSMRSLLRFAPDGTTTQEVFTSGEAYLSVHTSGTDADAATLAAEVYAGWKSRPFEYTTEWPIRMAVVRTPAAVTHVLVDVCHLAADGSGLATMIRELPQRHALASSIAGGPLELAAQQRRSTRQTDNAMRFWETHLRTIDTNRFPAGHRPPPAPRFRRLIWTSPALHAASERVASRLSVDTAPVLLAAYATAFARVVAAPRFVTQVIVGNRFRPGLADVVTPLAQNGLVVIDTSRATAEETIHRARQASMAASKYAYYDPAARDALLDRVSKDRGEPMDLQVLYNDRRTATNLAARPWTQAEIGALRPQTRLVSEAELPYFNEKLMLNVDDIEDTTQITTEVDTAYLPMPALHRLLAEMEHFTVTAANSPPTPATP
ncbi:condensation domain-containing protein [Dactylosporangium matsuzakiense]|uniref:Condensation domain-containing protein n=1 Tax=Dactylosporangium matsuzakiense TaxID=53360 RepID=A0A9W6KIF7_9ACTN|nr:condensation domain-containing protein [Dactylosporangium matsuzakiense]UWZ47326.1 hypothetical protein Dmats_13520 [Dactylosporangium matsuzakiense]GLL01380.1 hypothetical protein GCM10017581_031210 [Dactylosporangium matsuzakiense]